MEQDQAEVENLTHEEAIEKMKELVKHNDICLFSTQINYSPLHTRPMSTQRVDDEGNFWFLSSDDSDKNSEIMDDSQVQLFYSNPAKSEYMTVYGRASVSRDKNKIDELWTSIAKAWFKAGKDDPRITVIKIKPEEAYYWDTRSNKMVSMIRALTLMVSGKVMNDSVEGRITL
jgi:general stress protein 26